MLAGIAEETAAAIESKKIAKKQAEEAKVLEQKQREEEKRLRALAAYKAAKASI